MINKKRLALVTGICGGIGQSIATSILASGAEVVVTDLPGIIVITLFLNLASILSLLI